MISLITGLPGNGKTLFALWYIKQKAEKEKREVYYHNIKDLNLPWTECQPEKWMDLPPRSILVLDEAQFVFPRKPNGAKLPDHYEQLATHRHRGIDIFLITQHPSLLDNFVRQLVGQHFHSIRKFGMARSTIYEWSAANASPQSQSSYKNAVSMKWAYPKEVFAWYKSAEVHTVKRSIPMKLILAALFVVAVVVAAYFNLGRVHGDKSRIEGVEPAPAGVATSPGQVGAGPSGQGPKLAAFDPVADAKHFVAMNTPRVEGLPQTAPKYDALTAPVRVPIPAMCVQVGSVRDKKAVGCKCYSQQATKLDIPFNMCIEFARSGFFREFDADRDKQAEERTASSVKVLSSRPDVPLNPSPSSAYALAFDQTEKPRSEPSRPSAPQSGEMRTAVVHDGSIYVR